MATTFNSLSSTTEAKLSVQVALYLNKLTTRTESPPTVDGRKLEAKAPVRTIFTTSTNGTRMPCDRNRISQRNELSSIAEKYRAKTKGISQTGVLVRLVQVADQFWRETSQINSNEETS